MSKAYKKEKLGTVHGSLVSPEVFPSPHSPEEEEAFKKLLERLQPFLMGTMNEIVNLAIEENYDIRQGDIWVLIIQYIDNYFITQNIGQAYTGGAGIEIDANVINVDLGSEPGLEISSAKLVAKPNNDAAMDKSASGLEVVLGSEILTGEGSAEGGGIGFGDAGGLRIAPEDFLVTE